MKFLANMSKNLIFKYLIDGFSANLWDGKNTIELFLEMLENGKIEAVSNFEIKYGEHNGLFC